MIAAVLWIAGGFFLLKVLKGAWVAAQGALMVLLGICMWIMAIMLPPRKLPIAFSAVDPEQDPEDDPPVDPEFFEELERLDEDGIPIL